MSNISVGAFEEFFKAVHRDPDGKRPDPDPYSWQRRLAERAVQGNWPGAIDLPTGSGKTACIDVAVFALACQASRQVADRTAPRRIFFCVNRRVIVDEAYQRAQRIAERLWKAERDHDLGRPVLFEVAAALRQVAGTTKDDGSPPLDVLELRGGIYRDNRWARSAAQPTIVCTTIDQLGSRLLFRGYGVSPNAAPIQAALIAYDSLVLLDEAHISKPFLETLANVRRFLDPETWAEEPIGARSMIVVPMTATPPNDVDASEVIRLDDEDRNNKSLDDRLRAAKRASLRPVADVSRAIVEHAGIQAQAGPVAIGIIVNRVATAKEIYNGLREEHPDTEAELVIGAMRPIDRDEQSGRLARLVGPQRPPVSEKTSFVVATQCLEVGADYDFDVLLIECASMDALRQRFGRLNRGGRKIVARAVIVVKEKDVKPDDALDDENPLDPIYGNASARTWNWLWDCAEVDNRPGVPEAGETGKRAKIKAKTEADTRTIDFGIDAFNALLNEQPERGRIPIELLAPSASLPAPVMFPAYVDFWCQTSPIPVPDPDVSLFIHGEQRGEPDVQVCWRADLIEDDRMSQGQWCDVVSLLPPTAAECMSVPISRIRRWLAQAEDGPPDLGDLLEVAGQAGGGSDGPDHGHKEQLLRTSGVLWRGAANSEVIRSVNELRPGDTLVLPVAGKGWEELGHIPLSESRNPAPTGESQPGVSNPPHVAFEIDVAESAFQSARDKGVLRLHPSRLVSLPKSEGIKALVARAADFEDPPKRGELRDLIIEAAKGLSDDGNALRKRLEDFVVRGFLSEPYPDRRGIVLTTRKRIMESTSWFLPSLDEGDDEASRVGLRRSVSLADHTDHVVMGLDHTLVSVPTKVRAEAYGIAARRHDWGKADERFQALLRGTDRTDAWLFAGESATLLAKSDGLPRTPRERNEARERSGLPAGFRHEMLSVQLAERSGISALDPAESELMLHLIAAHHGNGRPFAPVVADDDPPDVEYEGVVLDSADRKQRPPHRLDSGVAERFWSLTRRYGWWGLAYLESLLRLADQQASADEESGKHDNKVNPELAEANA